MTDVLTLKHIRRTKVGEIADDLYKGTRGKFSDQTILKVAVIFARSQFAEIRELGYRFVLKYSIQTQNYYPLYDFASNLGFAPIAELLVQKEFIPNNEGFISNFLSAYRSNFKRENLIQTEAQAELFDSFSTYAKQSVTVIAPTSYGKSQLIEELIVERKDENIAIVVPTKALVAQTRRRIMQVLGREEQRRVVVHHDMSYDSSKPIIAVVTQERLLRLLQKSSSLKFDQLIIDEAHNLLGGDKRARLLASVIMIANSRNPNLAKKYLTPFLVEISNLDLLDQISQTIELRILEKLKSEEYFCCDLLSSAPVKLYDQYLDRFIAIKKQEARSEVTFILGEGRAKNIVYLNKPKDIEKFAFELARSMRPIDNVAIKKLCKEISEFVHPDYRMLYCLARGIIYHHGSVPETIRNFVEAAFRNVREVKWVVTNSTLLEGVNIPAEALFVLDHGLGNGLMTGPQFRNLVGRVSRFSEVFNYKHGGPHLLMPPIYLLKTSYSRRNCDIEGYLRKTVKVDASIADKVSNPLLKNVVLDEKVIFKRFEDFTIMGNVEPELAQERSTPVAVTQFGKSCFIHSVHEIPILACEEEILKKIFDDKEEHGSINDSKNLMSAIAKYFISYVKEDSVESSRDFLALKRLLQESAQTFYAMFFDWRINQSNYLRMIANFLKYWKKIENSSPYVFAGRWGNISRDQTKRNNFYIDVRQLNDYERVNLAILRIKEEQDFIDNKLVKFVEVLNDIGLIDEELYNKIKYGTNDSEKISLVRAGFSHIVAHVLLTKYQEFISFKEGEVLVINSNIRNKFSAEAEQEIIISEVEASGLLH